MSTEPTFHEHDDSLAVRVLRSEFAYEQFVTNAATTLMQAAQGGFLTRVLSEAGTMIYGDAKRPSGAEEVYDPLVIELGVAMMIAQTNVAEILKPGFPAGYTRENMPLDLKDQLFYCPNCGIKQVHDVETFVSVTGGEVEGELDEHMLTCPRCMTQFTVYHSTVPL